MSDRQAQRWARQRQRGLLRFILVNGVVYWGCLSAVLAAAFGQLLGIERTFIEQVGINLIFFPLGGGIIFGPLVWSIAESQYEQWQRAVARRQTHAS